MSIELVPSTVWESSVYKLMSREVWDSIRNDFIKENGRKCQVCGETSGTMNLHEIWNYDDKKHVQKLEGFILLCRMCYHVKHIGLAGILANQGKLDYDKAIEHFCKVNDCTKKEFEKHKAKAFEIWRERSEYEWNQDFGKYKEFIKQ
ncbi:HNH endonuclease [Candidatus Bathyarchaeota archaeon]|nr:HNH endonuclease [Candidatus Bathyarchaeota archaeon]